MTDRNAHPQQPGGIAGFFLRRWRCQVPLTILFWRDMVLVATAINLATSGLSLALLGMGLATPIWLAAYLLPLPYNIFLFAAVWRTSGQVGGWEAHIAPLAATAWLVIATII